MYVCMDIDAAQIFSFRSRASTMPVMISFRRSFSRLEEPTENKYFKLQTLPSSFAMALTLQDLYAAFVLIEEFLGWLPCQQLRCTRRYALHHTAAARLHKLVRQLDETVALQAAPNWHQEGQALWRLLLARITACQTPRVVHPLETGERTVVIRYAAGQGPAWLSRTDGQVLERASVRHNCFPDSAGFGPALDILSNHGQHFRRFGHVTWFRVGRNLAFRTETVRLDCILLGFEVSLRSRTQWVTPIPRPPVRMG